MKNFLSSFQKKSIGKALKIIMLLATLLFSIPSFAQEQAPKEEITDDVVVYFEATRCYGTCPVFSYKIYEDGTAEYIGKEFVEKEGVYEADISPEVMEELVELFEKYDFFDFKDRYTDHVSDLPTVYIYFSHEGKSKKITDYHGAPEALKELETEVLEKLRSLDWKKIEGKSLEELTR